MLCKKLSGLMYTLDEVQEFVTKQFQDAECINEPVKLIFEIELDSRLIESIFSDQQKFWLNADTYDMETIKRNFHQLINLQIFFFCHLNSDLVTIGR